VIDDSAIAALAALADAETPEDVRRAMAHARVTLNGYSALFEPLLSKIAGRAMDLAELSRLAGTDSLTGVANRGAFTDALNREMAIHARNQSGCAVVLLDLDDLKVLNDTHGHATGDRASISMAVAAAETLRGSDLVARLGGDEFAILLPRIDEAGAREVAERVRAAVERVIVADAPLRVSIGVAAARPGATEGSELLEEADTDLYHDKRMRKRPSTVTLRRRQGVEPRPADQAARR
jgi:diguanylate cyclase (GGDEF)-like protein